MKKALSVAGIQSRVNRSNHQLNSDRIALCESKGIDILSELSEFHSNPTTSWGLKKEGKLTKSQRSSRKKVFRVSWIRAISRSGICREGYHVIYNTTSLKFEETKIIDDEKKVKGSKGNKKSSKKTERIISLQTIKKDIQTMKMNTNQVSNLINSLLKGRNDLDEILTKIGMTKVKK